MSCLFFFTDTATTEIYTLSLHDALPISGRRAGHRGARSDARAAARWGRRSRSRGSRSRATTPTRSEEHTSELQSHSDLVCRLLLEKKKKKNKKQTNRNTQQRYKPTHKQQ